MQQLKVLMQYEMSYFLGFKFMVILNLHGIPFHAVVVFSPEHDFLFKSASSDCDVLQKFCFGVYSSRNAKSFR